MKADTYTTSSSVEMKIGVNWKRLLWVIFITLYTGLFFYNCLRPFPNWVIPYIYTIILILWLGKEYYVKNLFFQSGFLPIELYGFSLRALFALFFYSAFIIGIITVVGWHKYQIGLYPVIHLIGIALLVYSIILRGQTLNKEAITIKGISNFYYSVILLITSLALGYGSYILIIYIVIAGLPLVFLQKTYEKRVFQEFEDFVHNEQKINKSFNREDCERLWEKYLEKKLPRRKK